MRPRKKTGLPEALRVVAAGLKEARPFAEVEPIESIPTVLSGFNRAIQLGGLPLGCVTVVHGPTYGGKTAFAIAAGVISFQMRGDLAVYVDAERAADVRVWFKRLGVELGDGLYLEPRTYEEVLNSSLRLVDNFQKAKAEGKIEESRALCIILDSMTKCIPQAELDKVQNEKKFDRAAGRFRAAFNKFFLDALGSKIGRSRIAYIVIAHEKKEAGAMPWEAQYRVVGGASLLYDARSEVRVTFAGLEPKEKGPKIRRRHRVKVIKNKVGFPGTECYFWTATREGYERGVPALDLGYTAWQEAKRLGLARQGKQAWSLPLLGLRGYETKLIARLNEDAELWRALHSALCEVPEGGGQDV